MGVELAKSVEGYLLIDEQLHPNQLEVGPPELFVCARGLWRSSAGLSLHTQGRLAVEGDSPLYLCTYVPYQEHLLPADAIRLCLGLLTLSSSSIATSIPQKTPESSTLPVSYPLLLHPALQVGVLLSNPLNVSLYAEIDINSWREAQ